jgi:hypothetical protein
MLVRKAEFEPTEPDVALRHSTFVRKAQVETKPGLAETLACSPPLSAESTIKILTEPSPGPTLSLQQCAHPVLQDRPLQNDNGTATLTAQCQGMRGFVTDRHMDEAEAAFPGIVAFYATLENKPKTFLNLMALFFDWQDAQAK